jgi:hypothetical protein
MQRPLMRFAAPSAPSTSRVHSTRAYLTRYVPPSGFRTLLTVCSSTGYPALFRAGALMEFLTLQSFSLDRSCNASRRASTLLPLRSSLSRRATTGALRRPCSRPRGVPNVSRRPLVSRSRPEGTRPRGEARLQGFVPRCESVTTTIAIRRSSCPMLSWASGSPTGCSLPSPSRRLPKGSD